MRLRTPLFKLVRTHCHSYTVNEIEDTTVQAGENTLSQLHSLMRLKTQTTVQASENTL